MASTKADHFIFEPGKQIHLSRCHICIQVDNIFTVFSSKVILRFGRDYIQHPNALSIF